MLQSSLFEISIKCLPLALVPLSEAMANGSSITPHQANTEAEALAECGKLVQMGMASRSRGQTFIGIKRKSCGGSISRPPI